MMKRKLNNMPSIAKSLAMQERAEKRIPGISQLLSKRPDQFSSGVWPGYFSKAQGAEIWDLDNNKYIDMSIGGIGANVLGYADPDVDEAVTGAIQNGSSSSLNCSEEVELADVLCTLHTWAEKVRYSRTGGEAMAIAVRIARAYTGKDKIAFCGYHGWHDWYLATNLQDGDGLEEHLLPGLEANGVPHALKGTTLPFRYNKINELKSILLNNKNEVAAIIMEPIRNVYPDKRFLHEVKALAEDSGAVFIFDEISSGFRMNTGGAHLLFEVHPDLAVFSKALGNGYPIAAIIGKGEIMQAAEHTFISSTSWTERIGPVAALATIEKHKKNNVSEHLMDIGRKIQEGWKNCAAQHSLPIDIKGIPALTHFTFENENHLALKALFVQLMLERGFLASNIFYAMYSHTEDHVKRYLIALAEVFGEITSLQGKEGDIMKKLRGKPANAGFQRLN